MMRSRTGPPETVVRSTPVTSATNPVWRGRASSISDSIRYTKQGRKRPAVLLGHSWARLGASRQDGGGRFAGRAAVEQGVGGAEPGFPPGAVDREGRDDEQVVAAQVNVLDEVPRLDPRAE